MAAGSCVSMVRLSRRAVVRGPQGTVEGALPDATGYGQPKPDRHDPPLLFHLGRDPSEKFDLSKNDPKVIEGFTKLVEDHKAGMKPGPNQLNTRAKKK